MVLELAQYLLILYAICFCILVPLVPEVRTTLKHYLNIRNTMARPNKKEYEGVKDDDHDDDEGEGKDDSDNDSDDEEHEDADPIIQHNRAPRRAAGDGLGGYSALSIDREGSYPQVSIMWRILDGLTDWTRYRRRRRRFSSRAGGDYYDDVDFERYDSDFCKWFGWHLRSGCQKLLLAILLFAMAFLLGQAGFSHDHRTSVSGDGNGGGNKWWDMYVGHYKNGGLLRRPRQSYDEDDDWQYEPLTDDFPNQDDLDMNAYSPKDLSQSASQSASSRVSSLIIDMGITDIVVLGERHCGVDWLVEKFQALYPHQHVRSGFLPGHDGGRGAGRSGTWFQDQDDGDQSVGRERERRGWVRKESGATSNERILVVAVFVNPFDWLEMMRLDPIHAPAHMGLGRKQFAEAYWSPSYGSGGVADGGDGFVAAGSWEDKDDDDGFTAHDDLYSSQKTKSDPLANPLAPNTDDWDDGSDLQDQLALMADDAYVRQYANKPDDSGDFEFWDNYRKMTDDGFVDKYGNDPHKRANSGPCQLSFPPLRVNPCQPQELEWGEEYELTPIYELRSDGSGKPYDNILQMRADKIRAAAEKTMRHRGVRSIITVKYEEMVQPSTAEVPGIGVVVDRIQDRTGLEADDTSGWRNPTEMGVHHPFSAYPVGCSGHLCLPSILRMHEDIEYVAYVNERVDWSAEELMGYQKREVPKHEVDVEVIVVLGERHSGATWLADRLAHCFPDIEVKTELGDRPGKWFQREPKDPMRPTLVISLFLNPYDWVDLMRHDPINAPTHKNLPWDEFVQTPWTRKHSNLDEEILNTETAVCSFGFSYNEVIPCRTHREPSSDSFPLYELHRFGGSSGKVAGTPYSSVVELRADKIRNFLDVASYKGVEDFISLHYEDLVVLDHGISNYKDHQYSSSTVPSMLPFPGVAGLLELIQVRTTLVPDATVDWIEDDYFKAAPMGKGRADLNSEYSEWMGKNVDWETERLVGYERWKP